MNSMWKLTGLATLIVLLGTERATAITCTISEEERQEFLGELCIIASGTDNLVFTEKACVPRAAQLAVDAHLGLIEHHRNCGWTDIADAFEEHGTSSLIFLEAMTICVGYRVDMNALMEEARPAIVRTATDIGCPPSMRRRLAGELPETRQLLEFEKDQDNLRQELEMLGLAVDNNGALIQHEHD
ncbi:MAG: hypothetical protein GY789_18655 [Hyphomicrobiales bacterium]|nr:hypothetical protein [Hyphomicrobiales bacterium]